MKRIAICLLLALAVLCLQAFAESSGGLVIEDGTLMPMLEYSNPRSSAYSNEDSDILRFCVYVETDNDTDGDGLADLVKAMVQVPRAAVEGQYRAAVIYDPTPYGAGTYEKASEGAADLYNEVPFDYNELYQSCEKREPAGEMSTLEAASQADPYRDWNYTVPISGARGYSDLNSYDYYLVRGFAIVEACGIGTYGSEGFELCGTHLERDSHRAVVEWLTGDRRAFTDRVNNLEIKADWCNGKVAMTGTSYGGTLPYEVATTGVKGLETIIPVAGIASWYDYTNSQGVATILDVNYADTLSAYNCGGTFLDRDWTVSNKRYGSWLWQISQDQLATNGNYGPIWEESDYSGDWENIHCSALIVQGLNDFNVTTRQADLMAQAFERAGMNFKLVLHQDGHNTTDNTIVGGELWNEIMTRWLAHYLYGVDNGAEDMPAVQAQSNVDGSWTAYDSWRDFNYVDAAVAYDAPRSVVTSKGLAAVVRQYITDRNQDLSSVEQRDIYYASLDEKHAADYFIDLPEDTTVYGVPEIHLKLSSEVMDYEGLMITAVLVDMADNGEAFEAYMLKDRLDQTLPVRVIGEYGESGEEVIEYVQDYTQVKAISYGWTDLTNPGGGYDNGDYTETADIEAGTFYDYTFYMLPTVYTVAPGHHLRLILTTWDPYRVFLDESFETLDINKDAEEIDYDYSYIIDNEYIQVRMPVVEG